MSDVLFIQDTQDNFDDLEVKDPNTIYAISESGDFSNSSTEEGKLYVGQHQVSGFPTDYNNPVSPYSLMPPAAKAIQGTSIVFKGVNGGLYTIEDNPKIEIDPSWGLAILNIANSLTQGARPNAKQLLQQGFYRDGNLNFTDNSTLVLVCDKNGNHYTTSGLIKKFEDLSASDYAFIVLGTAVNSGATKGIACDFSNHRFYSRDNGLISAVDGMSITQPTFSLEKSATQNAGEFLNMTDISNKRRVFYTNINSPGVYRIYANLTLKTNIVTDSRISQEVYVGLFGGYDTTPQYKEHSPIFATKVSMIAANQKVNVLIEQQIEITAVDYDADKHLYIGYGVQTSTGTVDILGYDTLTQCSLSHFGVQLISKSSGYSAFAPNDYEDDSFII